MKISLQFLIFIIFFCFFFFLIKTTGFKFDMINFIRNNRNNNTASYYLKKKNNNKRTFIGLCECILLFAHVVCWVGFENIMF